MSVSRKKRQGRPHGSKQRRFWRIWGELSEALETESKSGYVGGPDLKDQAWLAEELRIAWKLNG